VSGSTADDWRTFASTGLEFAIRPLEDAGDPAANRALLARLDTLTPPVRSLIRDRRVDPDETRRWGWRERVQAMVREARGHPSLAGYFLADEPNPHDFGRLAELARAFADADSTHPAYVNLAGLGPRATRRDAAAWTDGATRLVRQGRLPQFTFDTYPFAHGVESRAFLSTLNAATEAAWRTKVPFGAVIQFTGFQDRDPVSAAQARYMAEEAVVHGARAIVWFTYWTPDPRDAAQRWRGGAVDYAGTSTTRRDTLAVIDHELLALAHWLGEANELEHYGDDLAADSSLAPLRGSLTIRRRFVYEFAGGPATVAARWGPGRTTALVVINRDWARPREFVLRWYLPYPQGHRVLDLQDPQQRWRLDPDPERTTCTVQPGGAVVILDGLGPAPRD